MDTLKPAPAPSQLLHDLESIRALLDEPQADAEPPLLTESIMLDSIPLLSEIVAPPPAPVPPTAPRIDLDSELRAAAQLILQDVLDDFAPQIEAELRRRLQARLERLLREQQR